MPAPDRDRPVFVFSAGWRSGSTLLQRYINSSDAVFVWGENYDLLRRLIAAFDEILKMQSLSREQIETIANEGHRAWVANLNPEPEAAIRAAVKAALLAYYESEPRHPRWGFKEVRGHAGHAALLLRMFPEGRVVHMVRDPAAMLASMAATSWYTTPEAALTLWGSVVERFAHEARTVRDPRILTIRLEDLLAQPVAVTDRLAAHLDIAPERFDISLLATKVRGDMPPPLARLGDAERAALARPDVATVARMHYPDWVAPD